MLLAVRGHHTIVNFSAQMAEIMASILRLSKALLRLLLLSHDIAYFSVLMTQRRSSSVIGISFKMVIRLVSLNRLI